MAYRAGKSDRELHEQSRESTARTVKSADPAKVKAAVKKIRTRDAELLKRLAR